MILAAGGTLNTFIILKFAGTVSMGGFLLITAQRERNGFIGRVLDLRTRDCRFHRHHCVESLSKAH